MTIIRRLALLVIAIGAVAGSARAQERQSDTDRRLVMPYVRSATDCVASAVRNRLSASPSQPELRAAINTVIETRLCSEAISDLEARYDSVYGGGSGSEFVRGPYLSDLPRAVKARLAVNDRVATTPPASVSALPSPTSTINNNDSKKQPQSPTISSKADNEARSYINSNLGSKEMTDDDLRYYISVALSLMAGSAFVLFVLGCGSKYVVFNSIVDAGMTASIFLIPIAVVIAASLSIIAFSSHETRPVTEIVAISKSNPMLGLVLVVGFLVWLWSFFGTIVSSIYFNGPIAGSLIACMKLSAALMLVIVWIGSFYVEDDRGPRRITITKLLLIGFAIWLASKFVNGPRVMEARADSGTGRDDGMVRV
ncbi:hypothetical protein SAMN02799631_00643 [Methylobacterium sp. 174MFSha1.1]|uniref:hypothetical protein n=1 Tax=Methylobacterium sp. 174MFSha1.1 TaxID=1502749 RepID=UPI0008E1FAF8|nr:hypothetical protein [Methylobacterium sp. 174MFSha1.1]SFU42803.1 hypothetical protein SAMN02799631_00643 [Methylobacterium sp. 174MFSha1.1]